MLESLQEKSNKTILVLANFDVGLYQFRRELLGQLLAKGNRVVISLPGGKLVKPLEEMGCEFIDTPVDRRGIDPKTDLKLFFTYRKLLKSVKPDLVITYTIKPNVYGGFACRLAGMPYAVNITGLGTAFQGSGLLRRLVTVMYKTALKKAKVVFFENAGNLQTLLELGICKQSQCHPLNGAGVNLEHYRYMPYPGDETTHFLFVGRIMREKGVDELFAAMERLREEGETCVLDVLGGYEENYAGQIQAYQDAGWLRYHGYQEDVRPFIAAAHCFTLPSWHEGMANTNLECAAMGRPVITSRIHGCMEAVVEGESGLLCEAKNADSLYAAMKTFLALPRAEREAMGKAARQHMEDRFDKMKVVEETIKELGL